MTAATRLIGKLVEYDRALDIHLGGLQEEFQDLERAWHGLSDVYQGAAAEEFRAAFLAATTRMRQYEHETRHLQNVLRRQIEFLRAFDRPGSIS